jgi:hypothetical protein
LVSNRKPYNRMLVHGDCLVRLPENRMNKVEGF